SDSLLSSHSTHAPLYPHSFPTRRSSDLHCGHAVGHLHVAVPVERVQDVATRTEGHSRRPLGLWRVAGVGHELPAPAAQLRHAAADPVRTARLRPAPPGSRSVGT